MKAQYLLRSGLAQTFIGLLRGIDVRHLDVRQVSAHVDDGFHCCPGEAAYLSQNKYSLGLGFDHHFFGVCDRDIGEAGNSGIRFIELSGFRKRSNFLLVQPPIFV